MAVTTKDIARELGYSVSTVSRALQGKIVSQRTIELVQAKAKEMGYRPHVGARMMAMGRTGELGLLVPNASNPYYGRYIENCQRSAHKRGFDIILGIYEESFGEYKTFLNTMLSSRRVDGLIIFPMFDLRTMQVLAESLDDELPIVLMGNTEVAGIHYVDVDYAQGGYDLGMHLLRLGHRRISFIIGGMSDEDMTGLVNLEGRLVGLRKAMAEYDLKLADEDVAFCRNSLVGGYEAGTALLSRPDRPTAIFAINDLIAVGAIRAAEKLGLRVPEDVSIVGFDNTEYAEIFEITTGDSNDALRADKTLQIIEDQLELTTSGPRQSVSAMIEPTMVVRNSSGTAPKLVAGGEKV